MTTRINAPTISIRHLGGSSLAGTTSGFDIETLLIGRGTDNDLAFDPHADREVSSRHARLTLRGGTLWLADLGSTNGTFIDGRRITDEQRIDPGAVVRLGESGPEFTAFVGEPDASAIPATMMPGAAPAHAAPRAVAAPHASPAANPVAPNGMIHVPLGNPTASAATSLAQTAAPRRRGGLRTILTLILLIAAAGVGYAFYSGQFSVGLPTLPAMARDNGESVYLVVVELERKDSGVVTIPIGTAWAVGDGLLATNAHVAEGVAEQLAEYKGRAFARSNTDEIVDLTIESWDIHPGYDQFTEWMIRYGADRVRKQGPLPNPFDVATFTISPAQHERMERALPLAPDRVLHDLAPGDDLTFFGFPMEGQAGGGTDAAMPLASFRSGSLDKMAGPFLGRASPQDSISLSYQFEITGGASGSPVFDDRGRVIGLVAAANMVSKGNRGARISVGGTSLGPRVDVLKELLDGVAGQRMDERAAEWPRLFEQWGKG